MLKKFDCGAATFSYQFTNNFRDSSVFVTHKHSYNMQWRIQGGSWGNFPQTTVAPGCNGVPLIKMLPFWCSSK